MEDVTIHERLARIETKLDAHGETDARIEAALVKNLENHEKRIGSLERNQWWAGGVVAGVMGLMKLLGK